MNILVKFQVSAYVNKIQRAEKLPIRIFKRNVSIEVRRMSPPERLRAMLEELGPTFIKFGQLLATRDDIIGPDYAAELSKLHNKVKPFPSAEARRIVEKELGMPVGAIFSSFETEPMASASIAQVHRATLKNGKKVVVKIQRPGIEETIKEDVRIMHYLAYLADKNIPELRPYDPKYLVDEFERSIIKELDFLREAKNSERLKENFKSDRGIYVPMVYEELCTKRVLTMEEIVGTKLTDILKSNSKKYNKRLIAERCLQAFFQMILVDGFYHGDLHPGNIMIMNRDVICFLDFGRCATIDKELADGVFRLALFAVKNDVNGLIAHLLRMGFIDESIDMKTFKADLIDLLDTHYSAEIKDVEIGHVLADLMSVISKYEFNRPRELAELTRSLLILEGVGMQLDPKFNVAEIFEPFATKYLDPGLNPVDFIDIAKASLLDLEYMAKDFPNNFRRFMKKVGEGKLTLELEHKNLDTLTKDLQDASDRISVALIMAALIVGSSIIGQISKPLGLAFFIISGAIGVWLVLKILVF